MISYDLKTYIWVGEYACLCGSGWFSSLRGSRQKIRNERQGPLSLLSDVVLFPCLLHRGIKPMLFLQLSTHYVDGWAWMGLLWRRMTLEWLKGGEMQCCLPHYGKCVLLQMWDQPTPRLNPDQLPAILKLIHGALLLSSVEHLVFFFFFKANIGFRCYKFCSCYVIHYLIIFPSFLWCSCYRRHHIKW